MADKPKHTYQFYMANGEHIMADANDIDIFEDCVALKKDDSNIPYMVISKTHLMAWECIR